MAREEYEHQLEELRHTEGVTEEDIKEFQRTALLRKSMDMIKQRAAFYDALRKNKGKSYCHVRSKVK